MNPYQNLQFQNPGNAFLQAYEGGRERRRESETQNALAKYAQNPDDPTAMEGLARFNPQMAIQLQERKRQEAMRGLEAHRESITMGAKLFREAKRRNPNVSDEQIYAQVLPALQQMRIDTSGWPQPGDPQLSQHIQNALTVADAMEPQKQSNGQIVPFTPGGGVARFNPETQQVEVLVMPNQGGQTAGTPVQQGGLPQVADQASYDAIPPGSQYVSPDGQVRVKQGGQTPQASGGFPR
jgi:hypothetical protein